ncbi:membrane protein [Bryobacterales bacterium F-183]|nr:membrane protein [Bryobacterales bacterium F-183]
MEWIWTAVIGFVAGALARAIMPGNQKMGCLLTICLGIAGSIVFTYLGQAAGWYGPTEGARFIGSTLGALIVLAIYGFLTKKKS